MTDNYSFQQIFHSLSWVRLCCARPRQPLHMLKHSQSTHWVPSSQCTFSLLEAHDNLFYVKKGMLTNKVNNKISFQVQRKISNIIRYWCTKYLRDHTIIFIFLFFKQLTHKSFFFNLANAGNSQLSYWILKSRIHAIRSYSLYAKHAIQEMSQTCAYNWKYLKWKHHIKRKFLLFQKGQLQLTKQSYLVCSCTDPHWSGVFPGRQSLGKHRDPDWPWHWVSG